MTQHDGWKAWIASYFRDPEGAWGNPAERQVLKIRSVLSIAKTRHGLDVEGLIEAVLQAVSLREPTAQRPVYLENLGGCGSHWISRMIAQAGGLADAGEVYLPPHAYAELSTGDLQHSARIMDAIEVAHGLLYGLRPDGFHSARMINSAHGCEKIAFYRKVRPGATIIHLIRDPRDRTLSVSLRKKEFRRYDAPDADDREYILSKATRSLSYWRRYEGLKRKADVEIRYEDFLADCPTQLAELLQAIDVHASADVVRDVSYRNSPEYLRTLSRKSADLGNLDQGGIATAWKDMDASVRRLLHSVTAPAIIAQGYAPCDCFPGTPLAMPRFDGTKRVMPSLAPEQSKLVDIRHPGSDRWRSFGETGGSVGNDVRLRLRYAGPASIDLAMLLRAWITDLCAAGTRLDDETLHAIGPLPRLACLDLAQSAITRFDGSSASSLFPSLQLVNLSGTAADASLPTSGPEVIRDY